MKIKKGDNVKMLSGKDRGKTGKVLRVDPDAARVVVEGLNLLVRNRRPRKQGEKGQRVQFPRTVHISTVALLCPKCGRAARVGYRIAADGAKARMCKQCEAEV